jgi:hypothetical protein
MTVAATSPRASNRIAKNADEVLKRYATQLTIALGLVVCITGVMMFFRWYKGEVEAMHEWLGMGFVAAAVLHSLRHRQSLTLMMSQYRTRLLLVGTALITAAFLVVPQQKAASPVKQTVNAVLRAPLSDIAPMFGLSATQAVERLTDSGVQNASSAKSIEVMARANHTAPMKLLNSILEPADKD